MIDKTGKVGGLGCAASLCWCGPLCRSLCRCKAGGTPGAPTPAARCAAPVPDWRALLPPWLVQVILSFNDQLGAEKHVGEALKALGK